MDSGPASLIWAARVALGGPAIKRSGVAEFCSINTFIAMAAYQPQTEKQTGKPSVAKHNCDCRRLRRAGDGNSYRIRPKSEGRMKGENSHIGKLKCRTSQCRMNGTCADLAHCVSWSQRSKSARI